MVYTLHHKRIRLHCSDPTVASHMFCLNHAALGHPILHRPSAVLFGGCQSRWSFLFLLYSFALNYIFFFTSSRIGLYKSVTAPTSFSDDTRFFYQWLYSSVPLSAIDPLSSFEDGPTIVFCKLK